MKMNVKNKAAFQKHIECDRPHTVFIVGSFFKLKKNPN